MPATDFGRHSVPQWPEMPILSGARQTVEDFYKLVDTETELAFRAWTDLFIPDGIMEIGPKYVKGHDGEWYKSTR